MEVRLIGDPVLRKRAKKVESFDENLKDIVDEMFSTMYLYDGVGLAAPQVGISLRFFIMDSRENEGNSLTANKEKGKKVVINPEIIEFLGEEISSEEGCLSIPDIFEDVVRAEGVKVRYQDLSGEVIEEELHGYQARIFQHETDHLEGILFTDKLPIVKKARLKKDLNKLIEKGKNRALELGDKVKL
ncbi:peptide deformylase [Petrotoga olearia]|uniref:Peptide deformylase n=2 Tax=Petrotoga olearia TaxID=156203 RepID=A0A2K1NWN3_9BACT|nr:peptide deformylase [Petrotoga olearia]PNR94946.1 peptide deformylase [Petrotoga olearia DSM 13574]RMA73244.1 peptide deformylase [Petrotoga olearia]